MSASALPSSPSSLSPVLLALLLALSPIASAPVAAATPSADDAGSAPADAPAPVPDPAAVAPTPMPPPPTEHAETEPAPESASPLAVTVDAAEDTLADGAADAAPSTPETPLAPKTPEMPDAPGAPEVAVPMAATDDADGTDADTDTNAAGNDDTDGDGEPLAAGVIERSRAELNAFRLSPGQRALFAAMPDSFRMPLGAPTPRSALPAPALQTAPARLAEDGTLTGIGRGIPFPDLETNDPDGGLKAIWNHLLRWRGAARTRTTLQIVTTADGTRVPTEIAERSRFPQGLEPARKGEAPALSERVFAVTGPERLAGAVKLLHTPLSGGALAWQRHPGQRLPGLKLTTEAGEDTTVLGAEGLYGEDQREGFAGPPERWRWRLLERRTLVVPWAAERFHAHDGDLDALLGPRHPNPERLRYEPREVYVLDARLEPGRLGPLPHRRYYLDAATWQVVLVEYHDRDDELVRLHEVHLRGFGDVLLPAVEVIYDLPSRRYLVAGIELAADATQPEADDPAAFEPGNAWRWAKAVGAVKPFRLFGW